MKTRILPVMLLMSVIALTSCDPEMWNPDGKIVYEENDLVHVIADSKVSSSFSYTYNGLNVRYEIEDTSLKAGEALKVSVDSDSETKPWVRLSVNEEEVLYTSDFPTAYETIMDKPGEYELTFNVYDEEAVFQFMISTTVSVK